MRMHLGATGSNCAGHRPPRRSARRLRGRRRCRSAPLLRQRCIGGGSVAGFADGADCGAIGVADGTALVCVAEAVGDSDGRGGADVVTPGEAASAAPGIAVADRNQLDMLSGSEAKVNPSAILRNSAVGAGVLLCTSTR